MHNTLKGLAAAAAIVALLGCSDMDSARLQDRYPSKPIELVAWAAPGGGSDRMCRTFARAAEGILPHRTYVINKSGGGRRLGWNGLCPEQAGGRLHPPGRHQQSRLYPA